MAFGQNIPQDFGKTYSTVGTIDFAGKIQTSLQERFDVNSAKIEEAIQRVSAIPLLRDKDKEYLQKNMSNILNTVNANIKASGGRSLLNNNMSGQLTKIVGSSIDDYLVEQMSISAQKQQFDTQVAEQRKKNPETFNNDNYQYSLDKAGWNEYMEGSEDSLKGGLQYIPYSDWSANATKKATELVKLKGKREIEIIDPNNPSVKIKKSIDGLKPEEVAEYLPNLLSGQDMQQMRIDGYMKAKRDPQGTKMEYDLVLDNQIQKAEIYKKSAESIFNTTTDAQKKADAKRQIDVYDAIITQAEQGKQMVDPEMMGFTVVSSQGKNILTDMLSTEESISYEANDIFFKTEDLRLKQAQLELDAEKASREKVTSDMASTQGFETTVIENQTPEIKDLYSVVKDEHDQKYNQIIGTGLSVLESATIDEGVKSQFKASLLRRGFTVNERGDGNFSIEKNPNSKLNNSKAIAINEAILESGALPKAEMALLDELVKDKNRLAKGLVEANKDFGKDVNTDELVNNLNTIQKTLTTALPFRAFDLTELSDNFTKVGLTVSGARFYDDDVENMTVTEGQKQRAKVASEIDGFVKNNGGIENLKQKVKINPALAQKMISLMDNAADVDSQVSRSDYGGGTITKNLTKAGENLERQGYTNFFKDKYAIQMTTEASKEEVINSISQDAIVTGKGFDVKKGGLTATPYYNTRGQVEGFDIVQYNTQDKEGSGIYTRARVAVSTSVGQKLMAKTAQGNEKDAMKVPNNTEITPMYKKVPTPFPTDVASTDKEYDEFISLGLINDPNFRPISMFLNSKTGTVKQNVLNYTKSQLMGQYEENEIEQILDTVDQRFRTGQYTTSLKSNKLPSQGTAKWVATFEKDGNTIIGAYNFSESPTLPKNAEMYFRAYPQYVFLNKIIESLKKGIITPTDL